MIDKERGVHKKKDEGRCPTIKEVFGYTSIVVLLIALLLPLEMNFGMIGFVRSLDLTTSDKNNLVYKILEKCGIVSFKEFSSIPTNEKVFTKEDLKKLSGDSDKICLAFLGKVYDVTSGRKHYGSGGGYSFFAGKDGSRGFVTGKFDEEGLVDNIEGLDPAAYLGLLDWQDMYTKEYIYLGKLEGYFYDSLGNPREGVKILDEGVKKGEKVKQEESDDNNKYPPCNSYYSQETGSEVWCSNKSGGISRDWVGLPRRFYKLGGKGHRCACVNMEYLSDPRFKEYKGCAPDAERCKVLND